MRPSEMDPERWRRIDELFDAALGRPPEERAAFVARSCEGSPSVRAEVEALLEAHGRVETSFEEPVARIGASVLTSADGRPQDRRMGPFRLIREIGRGGMGVVYMAEDTRLGRSVALKALPPLLADGEEAKKRFTQEARTVSALDHPNIATLYEIDVTDEGQPYMAFAFYEGETLEQRIDRGPVQVSDAVDVAIGIAQGLAAAHAQGIIHRDVKPSNVLLTEAGDVKLLDFGVAKMAGEDMSQQGVRMGTLSYMSPEQAGGGPSFDHRTDLWSLGVVLHEMLAGERPFCGPDRASLVRTILREPPASLTSQADEVPPGLARVCGTLLSKNPRERYGTAEDLLTDLRAVRGGPAPAPFVNRISSRFGTHVSLVRVVVVLLALGAGAGALWLMIGGSGPTGSLSPTAVQTVNPDALSSFQLGETYVVRRNREGIDLAKRYFQRAIEIDSSFASAYAGLAYAHHHAAEWGLERPAESYSTARTLAETALSMDSTLAGAYASLAAVSLRWDWDPQAAERMARRSIELDGSHLEAYRWLAQALSVTGRREEARSAGERARELDRQPPSYHMRRAITRYIDRDFTEAIQIARAAKEFDASTWQAPWLICLSMTAAGRHTEAFAECAEARLSSADNPMAVGALGYAYALGGRHEDALGLVEELETRAETDYVGGTQIALIYGALGRHDQAFQWLDRALEERDVVLVHLERGPFFDPLRSDARFDALQERMQWGGARD